MLALQVRDEVITVVADVLWVDGNRSTALDGIAAAIATLRAAPVSATAVAMLQAWQGARAGECARGR